MLCAGRHAPDQRSPPAQIAQWSVAGRALVHQRSPPAHHEIGLCAGGALDVQRKLTSAQRPIRCDFSKRPHSTIVAYIKSSMILGRPRELKISYIFLRTFFKRKINQRTLL